MNWEDTDARKKLTAKLREYMRLNNFVFRRADDFTVYYTVDQTLDSLPIV